MGYRDKSLTWSERLRQIGTYVLVSLCPGYGFYLENKRFEHLERAQTELHETHDDMIAIMCEKASSK